jgi:hypothetical protein
MNQNSRPHVSRKTQFRARCVCDRRQIEYLYKDACSPEDGCPRWTGRQGPVPSSGDGASAHLQGPGHQGCAHRLRLVRTALTSWAPSFHGVCSHTDLPPFPQTSSYARCFLRRRHPSGGWSDGRGLPNVSQVCVISYWNNVGTFHLRS